MNGRIEHGSLAVREGAFLRALTSRVFPFII